MFFQTKKYEIKLILNIYPSDFATKKITEVQKPLYYFFGMV